MSDVVCEREFNTTIDGVVRSIKVSWDRPQQDRGDWRCEHRIVWPDGTATTGYGVGVDSAGALLLAMKQVSAILYLTQPAVFRYEPDDILDLPILSNVQDLEDARTKGR
ncbi:hypothetical protein [Brevundimonas sp.]|uniref:DUF6968 family protein n=1 Tax=Brevundimonas sp. TaxID=1871086 RepID=UPI001A1CCE74|nr:hypothetical protein [Brevundimonas sp.]MBJ7483430.1 hypothetical protein [Brevundimonas sp.]